MKPLKHFYLLISSIVILFVAPYDVHAFSSAHAISLAGSIESDAMVYGEGKKKIYVFVDPQCPHSRDFISMIHENAKMRSLYRYYIFFYELKRFNSHNRIAAIYSSSSPIEQMLQVMVGLKDIPSLDTIDPKIEAKIDRISHVAEVIKISKRPYLIITKEWK